MVKKSININHSDASLLSFDGSYIQLSKNGGVKVGYGKNLEESVINNSSQYTLADYAGAVRINEKTNKLEYCDGKSWVELITEEEDVQTPLVYSMLF